MFVKLTSADQCGNDPCLCVDHHADLGVVGEDEYEATTTTTASTTTASTTTTATTKTFFNE